MTSSVRSVSFDEMVDALADIQRRKLLVALLDHNPQDDSPAVIGGAEVDTLQNLISMKHVHLPRLAEYGFIIWDEEQNEVSKGPQFDEIRPLIELLADHEDELPPDWI